MKYQILSLSWFFAVKGAIYCVVIAMVIFSHVKMTLLFSHVKICFHVKAHRVFHWCLYNNTIYLI